MHWTTFTKLERFATFYSLVQSSFCLIFPFHFCIFFTRTIKLFFYIYISYYITLSHHGCWSESNNEYGEVITPIEYKRFQLSILIFFLSWGWLKENDWFGRYLDLFLHMFTTCRWAYFNKLKGWLLLSHLDVWNSWCCINLLGRYTWIALNSWLLSHLIF